MGGLPLDLEREGPRQVDGVHPIYFGISEPTTP